MSSELQILLVEDNEQLREEMLDFLNRPGWVACAVGSGVEVDQHLAYTLANGENPAHKASNYTLASETKTATINPKALTITGSKAANKTYDGNTAATVTAGTLSGLVQGETLGATTATGQFADKNAGTGKNVTVAYTLVDGVGSITAGAPIGGPGGTIGGAVPIVTPGAKANFSRYGRAAPFSSRSSQWVGWHGR